MLDRRDLILGAILADFAYAGCFVSSFRHANQQVNPTVTLCMFSYLSLFVHESHERLKQLDPALAEAIAVSPETRAIVARSRHALKLFEDTSRGLTGQLDYFANEIIPAHRAYFIDGIRFPFLKFLGRDLGIFSYADVPVSSSHIATFMLGIDPAALVGDGAGSTISGIAREIGEYSTAWGVTLEESATSFLTYMRPELFTTKDVRADTAYRQRFNGPQTPELNALLLLFQAILNTLDRLLSLDAHSASRQTVIKLKYLTVYQVIRSLELLLAEQVEQLTLLSQQAIRSIIDHPTAKLLTDASKRPFRNTLMHYGPDSRVDLTRLSADLTLYGLVEQYFEIGAPELDALLTNLVTDTALSMNGWASL